MYKRNNLGAGQVTFRRFGGKGWCIFRSLNLCVRIGVLSVAMQATAVSAKNHAGVVTDAQQDSVGTEKELTEVAVTGSVAPLTQLQSARIVTVITRDDITQAGVQSVNDLFKLASGVDVRQRGGFGVQTDININGGTYEQVTILLNGVNISNPHTGHLAADFPVSVSDIERIEVLEGAASRVYGGQAFGGAINIVTKSPNPKLLTREASGYEKKNAFQTEAGLEGGMYSTIQGDARVAWQHKGLGMSLSGGGGRSGGGTINDDWQKGNLYFQGQYAFGGSNSSSISKSLNRLNWQFGFSRKSYGANTFYSSLSNDQWEQNERYLFSVGIETGGLLHLTPYIYWNRTYDNYQWHKGTPNNSHQTDVYGARISGWFNWICGRTAFAAEMRNEGILSSSLGVPMDTADWVWAHGAEKQYTRKYNRTNVSFNLEHNILLRHWTVSMGVIANMNTGVDSRWRFYPGVDVAYYPNAAWKFYMSYNMGFRLPSFTDLFYTSPDITGNNQLKPETNHSVHLGVKYQHNWISGNVRAFYNRGQNMIDYVKENWKDVAHADNFDRDQAGASAEVRMDLRRLLTLNSQLLTYMPTVKVAYTYLDGWRHGRYEIFTSLYGDDYLRHKLIVSINHKIWSRLTATWAVRYQSRMGAYQVYEGSSGSNVATDQLQEYTPYATLDLKLQWTAPRYEIYVNGTNITNCHYQDIGNIPQAGAWVMAGARIRLDW